MDVKYAQKDKDHQWIIKHVLVCNVLLIKSIDQIWNAHNVNGVQLDHFLHLEKLNVSCNLDQQLILVVLKAVKRIKYLILIELNVFHAQIIF